MTARYRFLMPFLIAAEEVTAASDRFEIAFPIPGVWFVKLAHSIRNRIYFHLTRRMAGS